MGVYFDFFLFLFFRTSVNILGGEEKEEEKKKTDGGRERIELQAPLLVWNCFCNPNNVLYFTGF